MTTFKVAYSKYLSTRATLLLAWPIAVPLALNRPEESPADAQELLCLKITHTKFVSLSAFAVGLPIRFSLVVFCISHLSILPSANAGIPSMQLRLESCLVWHRVRRDDIYQLKII